MSAEPMVVAFSVLAAIVPTLVYVGLIYWIDRYEKEPLGLLAVTFIWGSLPAIILALILEEIAGVPLAALSAQSAQFISASVFAPVIEEIVKGAALYALYRLFTNEFDDVLDGIVYGAVIGLGFGMTENLVYFLQSFGTGGWSTWLVTVGMRSTVFGLMHAFYTGLVGAALGYARESQGRLAKKWLPLIGLGAAIFAHAFHNGVLSLAASVPISSVAIAAVGDWSGILVLGAIVVLAWRRERDWIVAELGDEVRIGALSQQDYAVLASPRARTGVYLRYWREQGWTKATQWNRLQRNAVELAFRKQRARQDRGEKDAESIAMLRARVRQLGLALGRPLPQEMLCPSCGEPMRGQNRYCTHCGRQSL